MECVLLLYPVTNCRCNFKDILLLIFSSTYWDFNCTESSTLEVIPTWLRLNRTYIIIYINWVWTICTGIIPFIALVGLNCKIYYGLKSVQRNLNRHQRLANASDKRRKTAAAVAMAATPPATGAAVAETKLTTAAGETAPPLPSQSGPSRRQTLSANATRCCIRDQQVEEEEEKGLMEEEQEVGGNGVNGIDRTKEGEGTTNWTSIVKETWLTYEYVLFSGSADSIPLKSLANSQTLTPAGNSAPATTNTNGAAGGSGGGGGGRSLPSRNHPATLTNTIRKHNSSFQRARTTAQRKILSAAQSREANMALILVSSVTAFLICHLPRMFMAV